MAAGDIHGEFEHWSMVVLYDPQSGAIVHAHQVVTARGGSHPDTPALEKQGLEHATHARKKPPQGAAFLHVNPREIDFDKSYAVDVAAKRLKEVHAEPRRAR